VDAARERIQALNPRVSVVGLTDSSVLDDRTALSAFDLICLTESDRNSIARINKTCRELGKKFYAAGSYGMHGYIFVDLNAHEYIM
jgi:ubiquitin-like 1-activating enzyme E1 A